MQRGGAHMREQGPCQLSQLGSTKPSGRGDNLDIMRGMNSESGDLIYLDPPFNSNADYAALIGSQAAGAEFKDTWGLNDINLAWHGLIRTDYPALYALLTAVRSVHGDSMAASQYGHYCI